jgi:DNA (cytosine-5)-methyltransferase 1
MKKKLRAIDLYAGVGGWSLGLAAAGVDVVASYEWWSPANTTNERNNRHKTYEVDIRTLPVASLPTNIDIVVGSPPCTQFSFSNRGGKGDIQDGLRDIKKFLEIIDYVKPKWWVMENVPRVAALLEKAFTKTGIFSDFSHLNPTITVIDSAAFGVPQRRKRALIGAFDLDLLLSYQAACKARTLGHVISALNKNSGSIDDPCWQISLDARVLRDHEIEISLSSEEERLNRDAKENHPIYNNMSFPDRLDRPSRTITATCTRVSRESVIVPTLSGRRGFRRLTVRERACLQGFPISYQFFGKSHSEKLKLIGNAIPPILTYYIGSAIKNTSRDKLVLHEHSKTVNADVTLEPPKTSPDSRGKFFNATRSFVAAIPELRYKSGTRFELSNKGEKSGDQVAWTMKFYWGNSKSIKVLDCDKQTNRLIERQVDSVFLRKFREAISVSVCETCSADIARALQSVWVHKERGFGPFDLVDTLSKIAVSAVKKLKRQNKSSKLDDEIWRCIMAALLVEKVGAPSSIGLKKIKENQLSVFVGLLISVTINEVFAAVRKNC